ncbi:PLASMODESMATA CALLOSE-BINDING PROTEIN 3-like protein [Carex littledalei]|uniref:PLASMODESMATA CALLOSE-BINDING PROTEIN 3-like protein n=1 Tax=Carex littledalei TaxID=544730 RepID=A0A833VCV4_9POAL|nr:PLASMODESMATA CALLOSE-BINDING PROTEIN 3-like protein [Carex littledalei]
MLPNLSIGNGEEEEMAQRISPIVYFHVAMDDLLHPLANGKKAHKLNTLLPLRHTYSATDVLHKIAGSGKVVYWHPLVILDHSGACEDQSNPTLQKTIDYACGAGTNCILIIQNGVCYNPNNIVSHCSYAAANPMLLELLYPFIDNTNHVHYYYIIIIKQKIMLDCTQRGSLCNVTAVARHRKKKKNGSSTL